MKSCPLKITIEHPTSGDLLFYHASPNSNTKGWKTLVSDDLDAEIRACPENILVGGHWHIPRTRSWNGKTLISTGSAGLPLSGKLDAEFLLLESTQNGWKHEHRSIPYASEEAVAEYIDSGWFALGGPMAWLLIGELATANRMMADFFPGFN
ncbi:hypothetical protein WDW86_10580 [Bdellovibrionota bacterium FG-2]